jgi:hypothetical protein
MATKYHTKIVISQRTNETVKSSRVSRVIRNGKVGVLDGEGALAKGQLEEAELVEQAAERPHVGLGGDGAAEVEVDHFGRSVRQSRVLFDLLLDTSHSVCLRIQHLARGRPKVAEHKVAVLILQDVLHLWIFFIENLNK